MNFCVHCGASIEPQAIICPKCGCPSGNGYILSIKKPYQFFLFSPVITVRVTGEHFQKEGTLRNSETLDFQVSPGEYLISVSASMRKAELRVQVNANKSVHLEWNRMSGGLDLWEE